MIINQVTSEEEQDALLYFKQQLKNMENTSGVIFELPIVSNEKMIKKDIENLKVLLSLIEKQQEGLKKKDEIINLMAHLIYEVATSTPGTTFYYLRKMGFDDSKCDEKKCKLKNCEKCIKQYFANIVEEKNNDN